MNALAEPTELVEDMKEMLADISGQLISIGIVGQGGDRDS